MTQEQQAKPPVCRRGASKNGQSVGTIHFDCLTQCDFDQPFSYAGGS